MVTFRFFESKLLNIRNKRFKLIAKIWGIKEESTREDETLKMKVFVMHIERYG
jgi:hypothetical protein